MGAGIAFMGPELYASEVSPPHVRGLTSTLGELFVNFGILLGYLSGYARHLLLEASAHRPCDVPVHGAGSGSGGPHPHRKPQPACRWLLQPHWRWMVSIGALIPLASLISQMFIPETPRWLMDKGHTKRAVEVLKRTAHYTEGQLAAQVSELCCIFCPPLQVSGYL
jgi:MFS family permease